MEIFIKQCRELRPYHLKDGMLELALDSVLPEWKLCGIECNEWGTYVWWWAPTSTAIPSIWAWRG